MAPVVLSNSPNGAPGAPIPSLPRSQARQAPWGGMRGPQPRGGCHIVVGDSSHHRPGWHSPAQGPQPPRSRAPAPRQTRHLVVLKPGHQTCPPRPRAPRPRAILRGPQPRGLLAGAKHERSSRMGKDGSLADPGSSRRGLAAAAIPSSPRPRASACRLPSSAIASCPPHVFCLGLPRVPVLGDCPSLEFTTGPCSLPCVCQPHPPAPLQRQGSTGQSLLRSPLPVTFSCAGAWHRGNQRRPPAFPRQPQRSRRHKLPGHPLSQRRPRAGRAALGNLGAGHQPRVAPRPGLNPPAPSSPRPQRTTGTAVRVGCASAVQELGLNLPCPPPSLLNTLHFQSMKWLFFSLQSYQMENSWLLRRDKIKFCGVNKVAN